MSLQFLDQPPSAVRLNGELVSRIYLGGNIVFEAGGDLLMETGDSLLTETDDHLLLES